MADILHEEIFSSLNFRVQSCPRVGGGQCPPPPPLSKVGGGGGQLPPCPPSPTPLACALTVDKFKHARSWKSTVAGWLDRLPKLAQPYLCDNLVMFC